MLGDDDRYVREWFTYAARDLHAARVLVESDAAPVIAVIELQQALEKALKGFLLAHGWKLERTHDLVYLLAAASDHDGALEEFSDLCRIVAASYLDERYPGAGSADISRQHAKALVARGERLFAVLRGDSP